VQLSAPASCAAWSRTRVLINRWSCVLSVVLLLLLLLLLLPLFAAL
jgi:hypothetical protein